jgi:hypothetical protein
VLHPRELTRGWSAAIGALAIVLSGSAACRHRAVDATRWRIGMSRMPGLGFGPRYQVSLYPDGRMVYYGESDTKHHSWWRAKFDPHRFSELTAFLVDKNYGSWRDPQTQVVDAGLTDLSIAGPDGPNHVREGEADLPDGMGQAETKIDEIIVSATDWQQISKGTPQITLPSVPPVDTWLERERLAHAAMDKTHT